MTWMTNHLRRIAFLGTSLILLATAVSWLQHSGEFLLTADQQGQRLANRGADADAAQTYRDPFRQATSWYRAGDFKRAADLFSTIPGAEAAFNHGNALIMLGDYSNAILRYDRALELRSDWTAARRNREIAAGRAAKLDKEGGEMTGGKLAADEIVFDQSNSPGGSSDDDEETLSGDELSDSELQAVWLRQVQTTPRDFLKSKFAFQAAERSSAKAKNSREIIAGEKSNEGASP